MNRVLLRWASAWLFLLALASGSAHAHISGFTDTSVQIAASGVRIIYTVPSDNLLELDRASASVREPDAYLAAVRNGWAVESGGERCLINQARSRRLEQLPSYQFELSYVCPAGLDSLSLRYDLFFARWPDHENFVRVYMADQRMRMRFHLEQQRLDVPVRQLLGQWSQSLAPGFFDSDPHRVLKIDGKPTALPKVVVATPSLGSLNLSGTDPGFIKLGLNHIFTGADHVLFVVGLVMLTRRWQRLLVLVTAFTVAHSLTMALSTLGWVRLGPQLTDPLIALTIIYIGLENLWALRRRAVSDPRAEGRALAIRAALVFCFGLIHGVGFSYTLLEMGLREELLGALLFFNLGVEAGQLVIIAVAAPLVALAWRWPWGSKVRLGISAAVAAAGTAMLVSRF
jgi:hypothetical protein